MTDTIFTDRPEPPVPLSVADRLSRLRAFVGCIQDTLEVAGQEYSPHLGQRVWVCDLMDDELEKAIGRPGA
jgi:hypothetical protein